MLALMLCMATLPLVRQDADESRSLPDWVDRKGDVVDVFDDQRVLISLGKTHGVQKKMLLDVVRLQPPTYLGMVEVLELGEKHAIVRAVRTTRSSVKLMDHVWLAKNPTFHLMQPLPARTSEPEYRSHIGGAVIDLTVPKKPRNDK